MAAVGETHVGGHGFEKPEWQRIGWVMQDALVEHQMAFERLGTQRMGPHDVVHGAVGGSDPVVQL